MFCYINLICWIIRKGFGYNCGICAGSDKQLGAEARNVARPCDKTNPCPAPCTCTAGLNVCSCPYPPGADYFGEEDFIHPKHGGNQ